MDLAYRTLCAVLYNFVPTSGHPGGSVSSGRIAAGLLFDHLRYDIRRPGLAWADQLCYTAGHKALGLYAMLALRNELVRIAGPEFLPEASGQLRLEDLLGFRRNPSQKTPLMARLNSRTLDGHPTCATPFVPLATGASGVGIAAGLGLALAALDSYGSRAPSIHLLEGEGGLTPGRVQEALAAAAAMGLKNVYAHVDWNQSSIDSDRVCAQPGAPGDYVQWDPLELFHLHDWNVVDAVDGLDFRRVLAAQRLAESIRNDQPTAIIYRTVKGWGYGVTGRASHGAGHAFCSPGYYRAVEEFEKRFQTPLPRFSGDAAPENIERTYWDTLLALRGALEKRPELARAALQRVLAARENLRGLDRRERAQAPRLEKIYESALDSQSPPEELALKHGSPVSLRAALGGSLGYLNRLTQGGFLACAADLLDSTSLSALNAGFPQGFYHSGGNPGSRLASVGGICEDAMGGLMAGVSSFGRHIGVTSSYSGFIAALEHIAARLHGIGQQTRREATGEAFRTWIMINAHAGPMTGEDGPTHADPQALQLLQENFPKGILITLTPWEPQEVWPLLLAGLQARPAVLCPFVTRPAVAVPDRAALKIAPPGAAVKGMYAMRRTHKTNAVIVLQGSAVANVFVGDVLPQLDKQGVELNVFYVASAELFDLLPASEQEAIYPSELARCAMGITEFTLPVLYRWLQSEEGRLSSLHPFRNGKFLGSGSWQSLLAEAGLDGPSQLAAALKWRARF